MSALRFLLVGALGELTYLALFAIASHLHLRHARQPLQMARHRQLIGLVVLDQEQTHGQRSGCGNCTTTLAPPSGSLLAVIVPPWASLISLQRYRPSPTPAEPLPLQAKR